MSGNRLNVLLCKGLEFLILAFCVLYACHQLRLLLALEGNLCLGGDLPAHHYLVSHIVETRRVVSWAPGWWCGFPMFRFYFPLPYTSIALLSLVLGHNVAFNLGSILGAILLPISLWGSARIARLPRPMPSFTAALSLPILFDNSHVMWGVNAYSTLAGMVANSWSFALFPLCLALALRDARRERFSIVSALFFAALVLSHFFTSIIAVVSIGLFTLTLLCRHRVAAFATLAAEALVAVLLSLWWTLPLVKQRAYSVAFGEQWIISFFRQLPPMLSPCALAISAVAVCVLIAMSTRGQGEKSTTEADVFRSSCDWRDWMVLHVILTVVSVLLFYFGRYFGDVFVNCRLWPFITYGLFSLTALVWSLLASRVNAVSLGSAIFLVVCFLLAWRRQSSPENPEWSRHNYARIWAGYNFGGVEHLPEGRTVLGIASFLKGLDGRVAYDLHEGNEELGSVRSFEALPYLCGARIIEGGIVNSAMGALAAYSIQGEISESTAGWPLLVNPKMFRPSVGLRHLELFGARAFIARSPYSRQALADDPMWESVCKFGRDGQWEVFLSNLKGPALVRAWNCPLEVFDVGEDIQRDIVAWLDAQTAPLCVLLTEGQTTLPPWCLAALPASRYREWLMQNATPDLTPGWLGEVSESVEEASENELGTITFKTRHIGEPHIVAATWYSGLRLEGALGPWMLSNGHILVVPTQETVQIKRNLW